ncbi:MAG: PDZ domain-containing protein [Terracidiphilus sp.]|nr:PDZ domain-containing protein [Terracidiphilus sp.]
MVAMQMVAMRKSKAAWVFSGLVAALVVAAVAAVWPAAALAAAGPHIFQRPALSKDLIAFGYAGDLWTVPRAGGRATRLTTGVGIETSPVFSPDGQTIAFTGEYDGNTDVFTIPVAGGVPFRVTYHPATDAVVGWSADGKEILFRSDRDAVSRYTQLYTVPARGGIAKTLPLPMAYQGQFSPEGNQIAYSPLGPAFGFNYTAYVAWGNYHGGRASTIWITTLKGLDSAEIPHETASDLDPVWAAGAIYFLSGRAGPMTIFKYDPAAKTVTRALDNAGADIRTLAGEGGTLVYDQLGEIYLYDTASGQSRAVQIETDADLPEVRPRIESVADEIEHVTISPTGVRAAVEAHGEILTVAAKQGPTRDITNTPGAMEREPAWSPDGQSIAYFSDASGLYELDVAPQTGNDLAGAAAVKKFPLAKEPAYYFDPKWSPDSKRIVFHDNRLKIWVLDTTTGKLDLVNGENIYGGFSNESYEFAWSPDSKWIAYEQSMANHLHAIFLYSVETGKSTQVTSEMADADNPAFDREGKYLYFTASTNAGATSDGLDMTSDLYQVTSNVYAAVLASAEASPIAPELGDEKTASEKKADEKKSDDKPSDAKKDDAKAAGKDSDEKSAADKGGADKPAAPPKPVKVDLDGIQNRIVALPLPASVYVGLETGLKGSLYFLERSLSGRLAERGATLSRWTQEERKTEKLAEDVASFQISADGKKMLLAIQKGGPEEEGPGGSGSPQWVIVPADAPVKPGDGALNFSDLKVRVDPKAEWAQMYHEVWRIERAFFYDPHFHGTDTVADEKRLEPYVAAIASRADLNSIFQEMLGAFSVGHLRGTGGKIPAAKKVPGGLLGADYAIDNNRYCLKKIYTGGEFNPQIKAPLAQPGLNLKPGDCILAINGQELTAAVDIQQPLEGTSGLVTSLRVGNSDGKNARDVEVIPVASEARLRNIDWIEGNQKRVSDLSGGKLGYVYLPDTGEGGFTNFNRYYFAQTQKQGAIIDERFNGGGQVADYFVEVLGRHIESYWSPRYGAIEHTPNAGIYGPKVMIANEFSGSGGDALPWLFKQAKLGPLVGKRTWGGLVGIGPIPVLMDGGHVTSPSVAFFSPKGEWDVENHGVDPDYVVEQDPKAVSEGHDPQLEKAVALAMEELKKEPAKKVERPSYPNYHQ